VTPAIAEVAVVGGGIIGLAAAEALIQADADVRLFETSRPGGGQSAGVTRVFRHVHDRPELVALAKTARAEWEAWSERAGEPLVGDEGVLFAGPEAVGAGRFLADEGIQHRVVGEDEQRALLPVLEPPGGDALFDVGAGAIRAASAVGALASRLHGRISLEEVLAIQPDGEGAALLTPEGIRRCDRVLVCAGVRTPELARPLGLDIPVETSLHVRLTFSVRETHRGARLACWLDRTGAYGASVYSGPAPGGAGFVVGLATADQLREDPRFERLRGYVARGLPGLDSEPVAYRPCWLTVLPWHADAFAAWQTGPVTVFAGHNLFKFAPVLGRLLAEAVRSGRIPAELMPPR
jgi:sarcosine oxidase